MYIINVIDTRKLCTYMFEGQVINHTLCRLDIYDSFSWNQGPGQISKYTHLVYIYFVHCFELYHDLKQM